MTRLVNKETKLCISVAAHPSNFGTTLHNVAYEALGLNFIYKAFQVSDIEGVLAGVRALGIRGCSVSMPFKETVVSYLDDLDEAARMIGAVNTIVNEGGRLVGYNSDALGAKSALESLKIHFDEPVLLLGAGGVARAILFALRQMGFTQVSVANRDIDRIRLLQEILPCTPLSWSERHRLPVSLIINATPIGMSPNSGLMPVDEVYIHQARAVMDVVVAPMKTKLIASAMDAGKLCVPGYLMSIEQAMVQFALYTGKKAPRQVMESAIQKMR
jgi:shikimate dehydrogenase